MAPDINLGLWQQSCDQTLISLEEFSRNLLRSIGRFRDYGDKNRADVISSSCITCLAHLAILHEVACRVGRVDGEMYALCDSALQRLGMLTSEFYLDEYTYLDLLLGVRPSLCFFLTMVAQVEAGIGILEEIITSLRCPHRNSPLGRERVVTALPEGHWRKVLRFSGATPRSRTAADVLFGSVGGRYHRGFKVSELGVTRGEDRVWAVNGTLESTSIGLFSACVFGRMAPVTYYVLVTLSAHIPAGVVVIFL